MLFSHLVLLYFPLCPFFISFHLFIDQCVSNLLPIISLYHSYISSLNQIYSHLITILCTYFHCLKVISIHCLSPWCGLRCLVQIVFSAAFQWCQFFSFGLSAIQSTFWFCLLQFFYCVISLVGFILLFFLTWPHIYRIQYVTYVTIQWCIRSILIKIITLFVESTLVYLSSIRHVIWDICNKYNG